MWDDQPSLVPKFPDFTGIAMELSNNLPRPRSIRVCIDGSFRSLEPSPSNFVASKKSGRLMMGASHLGEPRSGVILMRAMGVPREMPSFESEMRFNRILSS